MKILNGWPHKELQLLVEHVVELQTALRQYTATGRLCEVVLSEDAGLAIGMIPGEIAIVHTPGGGVAVRILGGE